MNDAINFSDFYTFNAHYKQNISLLFSAATIFLAILMVCMLLAASTLK